MHSGLVHCPSQRDYWQLHSPLEQAGCTHKGSESSLFLPHNLVCSTYYIQDYKRKEKDARQKVSVLCYELPMHANTHPGEDCCSKQLGPGLKHALVFVFSFSRGKAFYSIWFHSTSDGTVRRYINCCNSMITNKIEHICPNFMRFKIIRNALIYVIWWESRGFE